MLRKPVVAPLLVKVCPFVVMAYADTVAPYAGEPLPELIVPVSFALDFPCTNAPNLAASPATVSVTATEATVQHTLDGMVSVQVVVDEPSRVDPEYVSQVIVQVPLFADGN